VRPLLSIVAGALVLGTGLFAQTVSGVLSAERDHSVLADEVFNTLGWELPDRGRAVKATADAAPGGAFDPRRLQQIPSRDLGYRATWHVVRYRYYGLDWDITGLQLTPNTAEPGLPTLAIINGGSANWYEFFLDPRNEPGLGQYLAQRIPVMLITIPGNYIDGGWTEPAFDQRVPGYVLGRSIPREEANIRNAVYTFQLIAEGVRRLLAQTTKGPLLIVGHSTGGELQFLLKESSLKSRLLDRSLGWGTGGPASITKEIDEQFGERPARVAQYGKYPRVDRLRARDAEGYISSNYVGPLNPARPSSTSSPLAVAEAWFAAENRRRPQFKQVLQDMEHQGMVEHRARLEQEIRDTLRGNSYGVEAQDVIRDLFVTMTPPLGGYRRMAWVVGRLDDGHWDPTPGKAREWNIAQRFRKANPDAPIRVLLVDAPITHYGHIERPKQLAAVLLDAAKWVAASASPRSE
jgi:pimeloyl-ACP methyl ester carboxylesterase